MVTINLNIHYDLDPKDRLTLYGKPLGQYEMERDLVENCILPAVKRYVSDTGKIPREKTQKCRK